VGRQSGESRVGDETTLERGTLALDRLELPQQFVGGTRQLAELLEQGLTAPVFQPIVCFPAARSRPGEGPARYAPRASSSPKEFFPIARVWIALPNFPTLPPPGGEGPDRVRREAAFLSSTPPSELGKPSRSPCALRRIDPISTSSSRSTRLAELRSSRSQRSRFAGNAPRPRRLVPERILQLAEVLLTSEVRYRMSATPSRRPRSGASWRC
jgi:hypothetical protein